MPLVRYLTVISMTKLLFFQKSSAVALKIEKEPVRPINTSLINLKTIWVDFIRVINLQHWLIEQILYDCEKVTVRAGPWPWRWRVLAFWLVEKCSLAIWLVHQISSMRWFFTLIRNLLYHDHWDYNLWHLKKMTLFVFYPSNAFSSSDSRTYSLRPQLCDIFRTQTKAAQSYCIIIVHFSYSLFQKQNLSIIISQLMI
jgi:hypothetical protein